MRKIINIFLILNASMYSQGVTFFREDITFRLNKEYFKVDGLYWFCNNSDKSVEKIIYYPFATNSSSEEIDSVDVFNITKSSEEKKKDFNYKGFKYLLKMAAYDTAIYRIRYRQKVICDSVKYILTSTSEWNRSLENAEYKLIINDTSEINKFSYKPNKIYNIENEKIYYWLRKNFFPKLDFVIFLRNSND